MISTSVAWFLFLVVAVTLKCNVICTSESLNSEDVDKSNRSVRSDVADTFPMWEDELDTERIVGGKYARKNQFPFMAAIHRMMGRGMVSQCGGTIITARWVLTAGHCVAYAPRQFLVVFGVNDKTGMAYNFYQGPGVSMMTNKVVLHHNFKPTMNDIGLLYMPRNIPFSESILPIKPANERGETFVDRMGIVIGWGKDRSTGSGTKRLKYATLPIISNYQCSSFWGITSKHVCTAANYGQDACQGDSGGPLVVVEDGIYVQIGIVSYGDVNCPSNRPGVFSRVSEYNDWIKSVIGPYL